MSQSDPPPACPTCGRVADPSVEPSPLAASPPPRPRFGAFTGVLRQDPKPLVIQMPPRAQDAPGRAEAAPPVQPGGHGENVKPGGAE